MRNTHPFWPVPLDFAREVKDVVEGLFPFSWLKTRGDGR